MKVYLVSIDVAQMLHYLPEAMICCSSAHCVGGSHVGMISIRLSSEVQTSVRWSICTPHALHFLSILVVDCVTCLPFPRRLACHASSLSLKSHSELRTPQSKKAAWCAGVDIRRMMNGT